MAKSKNFKLAVAAIVLSAAAIVLAITLAALVFSPKPVQKRELENMPIWDRPMMTYPEYRMMMNYGATTIDFDGTQVLVRKDDFSIYELRTLGLMLRAE